MFVETKIRSSVGKILLCDREQEEEIWQNGGGEKGSKKEHAHTNTHTHKHSRCIGIRWGKMEGLSGMQLNAVIRFEGQLYWLQRLEAMGGGGCRRSDCVCRFLSGGYNTSALTQTMMDRVEGRVRGDETGFPKTRQFKRKIQKMERMKLARSPCTEGSKEKFVYSF